MQYNYTCISIIDRGSIRPQVPRLPYKTGNLTLEVRKIPPEFNNIAKLNEHFGKFGNLTNIQVCDLYFFKCICTFLS